jgi:hypothetical protein
MQYNLTIKHKPGIHNRADALSRRPDYQTHTELQDEIALPDRLFVRTMSVSELDDAIKASQSDNDLIIQSLRQRFPLQVHDQAWHLNHRLVVVGNDELRRGIISLYHDFPTAGHPGGRKSLINIARDYWWPTMRTDVADFVKGCATCQATKPRTTQPKPPLFPIATHTDTLPFETIALDFIVKLPISHGYDSILSITDQGASKATFFLPCSEQIDAIGVAKLYAQHVFPHYGIPKRVISDRDTRFTARFTRELCRILDIKQNISTAYHPQTDGQSERSNQWVEQFLRIYANGTQDDWSDWLPIAQYTHNAWTNDTTGKAPFEYIMGYIPRAHQALRTSDVPTLSERSAHIQRLRWLAHKAVRHAQRMLVERRGKRFKPYEIGDKVWLEGTNLTISHPAKKFQPRRYGPFTITRVISDVAYQLMMPPHWKIHNVFHATLLTPYHETSIHGPNHPEPPPDIIDGEPEWEVEEITGIRTFGRKKEKQYRVRWKGYNAAHDTWEPASNVHAPDLIDAFNRQQQNRDKRTTNRDEDSSEPPFHISSITMSQDLTPPTFVTSRPGSPASPTIMQQIIELTNDEDLPDSHISVINQMAAYAEANTPPRHATPGAEEDGETVGELQYLPPPPAPPSEDGEEINYPPSPPYMPHSPTPEPFGPEPLEEILRMYRVPHDIRQDREGVMRLQRLPDAAHLPTYQNDPGWPWVPRQNYPANATERD